MKNGQVLLSNNENIRRAHATTGINILAEITA
jgi:hypothetical protein